MELVFSRSDKNKNMIKGKRIQYCWSFSTVLVKQVRKAFIYFLNKTIEKNQIILKNGTIVLVFSLAEPIFSLWSSACCKITAGQPFIIFISIKTCTVTS